MIAIRKQPEPKSLVQHRSRAFSDYSNLPEDAKQALRDALVSEQRGLCCYCMGRIRAARDGMKIEHWQCQDAHPDRQLDYSNLLAACFGGENESGPKHCDTQKGDAALKYNPSEPKHQIALRLRYTREGLIDSPDEEFRRQLVAVLNLNLKVLSNARKAVYQEVIAWWGRMNGKHQGKVPARVIQKKLSEYTKEHEYRPFVGVALWLLEPKLAKCKPAKRA
ncbi:MAG: retron system putative HNH endonuclease [Myxococcota bacterium]|jgi:uncharacterized protein (TIGR02646 family)|nr:retron system putative HNH endonuclease [Myxococcota bacterium]